MGSAGQQPTDYVNHPVNRHVSYYSLVLNMSSLMTSSPMTSSFITEHSNVEKIKKRRTVAESVASVGESGDCDRCLGTSIASLGINTHIHARPNDIIINAINDIIINAINDIISNAVNDAIINPVNDVIINPVNGIIFNDIIINAINDIIANTIQYNAQLLYIQVLTTCCADRRTT